MDIEIPVLVPWRTDGGRREDVWSLLKEHYWADNDVYEGEPDEGLFNRSQALNRAAAAAGDWDLAVIADADSLVHVAQLVGAIDVARETGRVTIAHSRWVDVHPDEVVQLLTQGFITWREKRAIYNHTVSSMLVVPREAWDTVHGFDEGFIGWGYEDNAFIRAVKVLYGPIERIDGTVWHLSHDRPQADVNRRSDPHFLANYRRWRKYQAATKPAVIEAVRAS